jgi:ribosomal protein L31E
MAKIERTFNVPLRKGFYKAPSYKKTAKAIRTLKEFLIKNFRCTVADIKIGRNLNLHMWKNGIKNPPHHVKINAVKEEDGTVRAELFGFKYSEPTAAEMEAKPDKEEKAEKSVSEKDVKDLTDELQDAVEEKPKKKAAKKTEEAKAEKPAEDSEVKAAEEPKKKAPRKPAVKKTVKSEKSDEE